MSIHIAKALGESYEAISLLAFNGLLTKREVTFCMRRLHAKAHINGVGIATTDVTGKPLVRQIRVHWMGHRGRFHSRTYPRWPGDKP
jgi:hypothetical protein